MKMSKDDGSKDIKSKTDSNQSRSVQTDCSGER